MKLTAILLLSAWLQVAAKGNAQTNCFTKKMTPLENAFQVNKQTSDASAGEYKAGLTLADGDVLDETVLKAYGTTSKGLTIENDPFYVIHRVLYENPLIIITPSDFESIAVLEDADATAIYGSRDTNVAILITTKKGKGKITHRFTHIFNRDLKKNRSCGKISSPGAASSYSYRNSEVTLPIIS